MEQLRSSQDSNWRSSEIPREAPLTKRVIVERASTRPHVEVLVQPRVEPLSRAEEIMRVVSETIRHGTDPEVYWERLNAAYAAYAGLPERRRATEIRLELNALIPHLAEARVREDATRFADPAFYVNRLRDELRELERQVQNADGREEDLRRLIDRARIKREQIGYAEEVAAQPGGWQELRKRAVRASGSVLDRGAPAPAQPAIKDRLADLRAERARLRFWEFGKKAEIDRRIAALNRARDRAA